MTAGKRGKELTDLGRRGNYVTFRLPLFLFPQAQKRKRDQMVWGAMKNLLFPSFRFLGGADYAPANIAHKLIQVLREKLPSDEYLIPSDVTPFKAN